MLRAMRTWTLAVLVLPASLIVVDGCSRDKTPVATSDSATASTSTVLAPKKVPGTDLVVPLPKGWAIEVMEPGPRPSPDAPAASGTADDVVVPLHTRTLLSARPTAPTPGMLVAPTLLVLEDPWLPVGTTGVDYLVAQRHSNQAVLGDHVRHVEAEPTRRDGRPAYHVRDAWTVDGDNDVHRDVSQEALLLIDAAATPNGTPGLIGYTVVLTLEQGERDALDPVLRGVLSGVHFEATPPAAP
jgi:hypothetical protein